MESIFAVLTGSSVRPRSLSQFYFMRFCTCANKDTIRAHHVLRPSVRISIHTHHRRFEPNWEGWFAMSPGTSHFHFFQNISSPPERKYHWFYWSRLKVSILLSRSFFWLRTFCGWKYFFLFTGSNTNAKNHELSFAGVFQVTKVEQILLYIFAYM